MNISRKYLEKVNNLTSTYTIKTPVLINQKINAICGAEIFFKCENFQKSGSFKFRAATNAVLNLDASQKKSGVITHSSGNFAQALSLASQNQSITAHIVMPENAPEIKKQSVLKSNSNLVVCKSTLKSREETSKEIQDKYRSHMNFHLLLH